MKQQEYYQSRRDVDDDDDDDDDDRKPPARPPSRSNGRSNLTNHDDEEEEEEEEHYSESGVNSHTTSSTAVGSVDHWSLRDHHHHHHHRTSSIADRRRRSTHSDWWHPTAAFASLWSPFRQSSSSSTTKVVPESVPSSSSQRPSHAGTDVDFMYQTPTNANMIHAIRNDMHQDRRRSTGIPHLTLATPYTPPNSHCHHHHGATTNALPQQHPTFHLSNSSSHPNAQTTTTPNDTLSGNALTTTTTMTIGHTTLSPSSPPVDHITNTTISSLQRNSMIYFGSTTVAWMVLWSHLLPPVVWYTLLWIIISTVFMIQAFYTTLQEYYYHMVVMGPGLGSLLLPPSVYNLLTQESLHEFLTDEVMVLEYRHLLLYFLPISSTQLRDLLRRISPQHQQRLQRRGEIGTLLLGESMMRIILGHAQYEQWRTRHSSSSSSSGLAALSDDGNHNHSNSNNNSMNGTSVIPRNQIPSSMILPHQVTSQQASPRRNTTLFSDHSFDDDDDDDHSDLGLDISGDDVIGGNEALAERLGLTTTTLPNEVIMTTTSHATDTNRNATAPTANDATDRVATYDDQEYQVLIDALWDSFYGAVWNPMTDYVTTTYMVPTLHRISRVTLHSGIVLLSISAGNIFGLWEWWYQIIMNNSRRVYLPTRGLLLPVAPQNRDPSSQPVTLSLPSFGLFSRPSTTTWSTALLGSASLGISYYSRRYVRRYDTTSIVDSYTDRNDHHETSNDSSQKESFKSAESPKKKE